MMKTGIWRAAPLRWLVVGLGALAALAVLLMVTLGGRHSGPIAHPTGGREIVIQMQSGGGMVPYLEGQTDRFPQFTLYGDGTLIYHTRGYYQTRLDEAAIQRLLHLALDDVGFFGLPNSLAQVEVYDAPGTSVMVNADGQGHTVSAMALGFGDDAAHDDQRARLLRLTHALGELMDDGAPAYVPASVRLFAEQAAFPGDAPALPTWPVAEVDLSEVMAGQGTGGSGFRVNGAAAAGALQAASEPTAFGGPGSVHIIRVVAVPDLP